jgi:hypothetical protein
MKAAHRLRRSTLYDQGKPASGEILGDAQGVERRFLIAHWLCSFDFAFLAERAS